MRRYKLLLTLFLLSTNVCASSFDEALIKYGVKLNQCSEIAKANNKAFPSSDWFESLMTQDKKNVILFISMDNRAACSNKERMELIESAKLIPEDQRNSVMILLKQSDYHQYIGSLDLDEIRKIQLLYSQPFDSLSVGQKLGLLD